MAENEVESYYGGKVPSYQWYIACIFQIWSLAPGGYEGSLKTESLVITMLEFWLA